MPAGRARHLCYCHSPMRYAWDQFEAYFGAARKGRLASRWIYRPILARLARWDAATAPRVHRFVANSAHVAARIRRYYNREATIVYPPVDTVFFHPAAVIPRSHFLIVSALVPYKRIELAMAACERAGAPLRIVGDGPDRRRLEAQAGRGVTFLGRVTDEEVRARIPGGRRRAAARRRGFRHRAGRSAGVRAAGRGAWRAAARSRRSSTARPACSSTEPTVDSLAAALARVASMRFDPARIRGHAERFSRERHIERMRTIIDETLAAPSGTRW